MVGVASNFVEFFADYNRIVLADFLGAQLTIIESTVVLVAVAVSGAEQPSTATLETSKADLLSTCDASI